MQRCSNASALVPVFRIFICNQIASNENLFSKKSCRFKKKKKDSRFQVITFKCRPIFNKSSSKKNRKAREATYQLTPRRMTIHRESSVRTSPTPSEYSTTWFNNNKIIGSLIYFSFLQEKKIQKHTSNVLTYLCLGWNLAAIFSRFI